MVAIHSRFGFCSSCAVLVAAQLWQVGFPVDLLDSTFCSPSSQHVPCQRACPFQTSSGAKQAIFFLRRIQPLWLGAILAAAAVQL